MQWFSVLAAALVWITTCAAQQSLPADLLLLANIKAKVAENSLHLPNYTCSETIERAQHFVSAKKFQNLDTVRLEVALVDGKELYGWPGSNRIAESELSGLVGGTIGNGDFGLLVRSIFHGSGTHFQYAGPADLDGKSSIRFDFNVPLLSSGYHLKVPPNEAVVGYHGSFWVQPDSLDLMRLQLEAEHIPEYLGLESSGKIIEYERMTIGASGFLLPKAAELSMTDFNGTESRNRSRFHSCRQYAGESVLSFGDPVASTPQEPGGRLREIRLPENFVAEVSLVTPIDSDTAAVGDLVQTKLEENVKLGRKIAIPKGAIFSGRIVQFSHQQHLYHLAFSLAAVDFEDRHADLDERENTFYMLTKSGILPIQLPMERHYAEEARPGEPLMFEASHLRLPKGLMLYLRSRLLKSDKQ